jgi:hypothetical protein
MAVMRRLPSLLAALAIIALAVTALAVAYT